MTHAHEFYRLAWITTHHNKSKYSNRLLNSYETIMQNLTIVDIEKVFHTYSVIIYLNNTNYSHIPPFSTDTIMRKTQCS